MAEIRSADDEALSSIIFLFGQFVLFAMFAWSLPLTGHHLSLHLSLHLFAECILFNVSAVFSIPD